MSKSESRKNKRYGWIADHPDRHDMEYKAVRLFGDEPLPPIFDMEDKCPPRFNQLDLGSCVANSINAVYLFDEIKQNKVSQFVPSRLFVYYNARLMEGTVKVDSGVQIRTGIKTLTKYGVCDEGLWPYNISKFTKKPVANAYKKALTGRISQYQRIPQDLNAMKTCLFSGIPFVFGFSVYSGFESNEVSRTGTANLPLRDEEFLGGHAVYCCGWNDETQRFKCVNSWGDEWGERGTFTLPYEYLLDSNLSADFWCINFVP